jgi:ABC-type transport system substrate-binding protein
MGSGAMLAANDRFVFGRPRIDQIEVRFITDMNTVTANLLAGTVDVPLGRGIRPEHALQLREMSQDLNVVVGKRVGSALPIFPQFMNPQPAIIANVELRRALLHALDRTEMDWVALPTPGFRAIGPSSRRSRGALSATRTISGARRR